MAPPLCAAHHLTHMPEMDGAPLIPPTAPIADGPVANYSGQQIPQSILPSVQVLPPSLGWQMITRSFRAEDQVPPPLPLPPIDTWLPPGFPGLDDPDDDTDYDDTLLLAVCCLLLAVGFWLLAVGC